MITVAPMASTQTDLKPTQLLPNIPLNKKISNLRRSSMRPYYYNELGDIMSNPLPSMITCSTSPHSPLKYRSLGSKFQEIQEQVEKKPLKKKDPVPHPSTLPLKASLHSKEVFVVEASEAPQVFGFYYNISRTAMSRQEKQENLKAFLSRCQHEFNKTKKFKYIFSTTGKLFQYLQDIPYSEKVLVVSHDIGLNDSQESANRSFTQIEEKFAIKASNFSAVQTFTSMSHNRPVERRVKTPRYSFNQLKVKLGQTAVKIDTELPKLFDLGMQKLKNKCSFPEAEIHKLYAKYKMLLHLSIARNPSHSIWDGVSRETFVDSYRGSEELNFVLGRVFDNIDQDCDGAISWEEYLTAMDVMFNGSYEQQIDLFFTVYDTDGNGNLSFEEIKNLCKLQLQNSDADNVIDELSHSFATLIFDITGTDYESEIPSEKIKQVLTRQTDKSLIEMFCSFSFMKNN
jgi:Ca2+-binding EF-hand superfamily protein